MALRTLVKVGGISNLSDARYCAGMGVDFLGFRVIEGHPDAISVKTFQDIRGWISGPQIVAEIYGIKSAEELKTIIENYQPDYVELELADWLVVGGVLEIPFILALKPHESLPPMATKPAYVLARVNDSSASKLVPEHEILAQVSNKEQLEETLQHTGISGINLMGGPEIRPGLKQYDELAEILESLEIE
jgi:phosphoribosylanthranilate isomerase